MPRHLKQQWTIEDYRSGLKRIRLTLDKRRAVYGKTDAEVLEKAKELAKAFDPGKLSSEKLTVKDYFEGTRADAGRLERKRFEIEPRSYDSYVYDYQAYIKPHPGRKQINVLKLTM